MLSALFLSMPALTGNVSVLQTSSETPTETAPVVTQPDANANVVAPDANLQPNVTVNASTVGNTTVNTTIPVANTNTAANKAVNAPANK